MREKEGRMYGQVHAGSWTDVVLGALGRPLLFVSIFLTEKGIQAISRVGVSREVLEVSVEGRRMKQPRSPGK